VVEAITVLVEFRVRLTVTPDTPVPSLVEVIAPLRAPLGAELVVKSQSGPAAGSPWLSSCYDRGIAMPVATMMM